LRISSTAVGKAVGRTPAPGHDGVMNGVIVAVALRGPRAFGKEVCPDVRLIPGFGVEGDVHGGATVRHRSRMRRTPGAPNLRQVHLIHGELHDELAEAGFAVGPGEMGENMTTRGVALLDLPVGTTLRLGPEAVIELTGLRNPCPQLDGLHPGLRAAVLDHDTAGNLVRKAGVMAVVLTGGVVRAGDAVEVTLPAPPHRPLEPV
jgi:MOSC domain-containing protein YiiM